MPIEAFWVAMVFAVPLAGWLSERPWMTRTWRATVHPRRVVEPLDAD